MSGIYNFVLVSHDRRRALPHKILIGQNDAEPMSQVALKILGYLLFYRQGLQIEPRLPQETFPFTPGLVQLDFENRPHLWVECGECGMKKLHRISLKAPEAEIWVLRSSVAEAEKLLRSMDKADLRRNRFGIVGFDSEMFQEFREHIDTRNELVWVGGTFDPPHLQFDLNGLWFDAPFACYRF